MPTDMNVSEASAAAASKSNTKQKERHIVTWTQQEDDILREQIGIHGTENWAIIAAKFKDKTTRQCRRRWYTYLNSDFKKGGWSPEEDMILCEFYLSKGVIVSSLGSLDGPCLSDIPLQAQRIFGNRWTEIAKVVSGRTDNAVKNRFSTLCKKRAKHDALSKENTSCISSNHKRSSVVITNGTSDSAPPLKKLRTHISETPQNNNLEGRLHREIGAKGTEELRHPFAVLGQNSHNVGGLSAQLHFNNTSIASNEVGNNKVQGTFIRRDDPKITSLMQQAELLTTLAAKVNTENTNQSLENAWKELQTFLNRAGEGELLKYRSPDDFPFGDFKELVEDLKSSNIGTMPSWRQPGLYESPGSSEYSTGSTLQSHTSGEKTEQLQAEVCSLNQDGTVFPQPTMFSENDDVVCEDGFSGTTVIGVGAQSSQTEVGNGGDGYVDGFCCSTSVAQVLNLSSSNEAKENVVTSALPHTEFSSPIQVTPLFQTFAAGIPTPKFTESERHFLMKTLGMTSPSPKPSPNTPQPPPCRRALLHSL